MMVSAFPVPPSEFALLADVGLGLIIGGILFVAATAYSVVASQQARKAAKRAAQGQVGLLVQTRAAAQPRRLIYGRRRVGGIEAFVGTSGTNNKYLHYILIWGEGPCESVDELWLDDEVVTLTANAYEGTLPSGRKIKVVSRLGGTDNNTAISTNLSVYVDEPVTMVDCTFTTGGQTGVTYHKLAIAAADLPLLENGARVEFAATALPTGLSASTWYRVWRYYDHWLVFPDATTNFLSANAINYTDSGTGVELSTDNTTADLPGWTSTDKLLGICYSWVRLEYDAEAFANGVPNLSAVVKGRNDIWNPVTATTEWTDNAALCWAHYLTLDPKIGPGADFDTEINEDALADAIALCDEDVDISTGGTEKRYTFNGVIELDANTEDILDRFRVAMGGPIVYTGGQWFPYPAAYDTPSFEITAAHLVQPFKGQSKAPRGEHVNLIRGTYVSEANNFQPTDFPAYSVPAYVTEDGRELPDDLDFTDCDSPTRARRLAKIFLERKRLARRVTVVCNIEAMQAQCGRTVLFHLPRWGFDHQPMDVLEYGFSIVDSQIQITVTLQETAASVYAWDPETEDQASSITTGTAPTVNPPDTYVDADLEEVIGGDEYTEIP